MKDLTKGNPAKVIMMFAFPLMLSYIFQQLYNIADSKIVSNYVSTNAFAAVGATSVVSNTLIGFLSGLTQGFAIPVANCFGAKNYERMRKYVAGGIILITLFTVALTFLGLYFIEDILILLKTPKDILPDAISYIKIILVGIVFTAIYNMSSNLLRAVGDSKTPLYCLSIAVVVNIVLDLLFVKGLDLKIKGAAYATLIAQAVAAFLCVGIIFIKFKELLPKREWRLEKGQYSELFTTGISMALMSCIVNIGTVVLQGAINSLGTNIVAAHTAARRVFDILTVMLFTVGVSMTTYVSQNMGAGKPERVREGIRSAMIIELIMTTFLVIINFLFARPVLQWIASSATDEVVDSAVMYSRISISFFYVLGIVFVLRSSLQGMGRKVIPVFSSFLEMGVKVVSASFLVPVFKYKGVAFTEPISWCIMFILLMIAYLTKKPEDILKESKS